MVSLLLILAFLLLLLSGCGTPSYPPQSPPATRQHAEKVFQKLHQEEQRVKQSEESTTTTSRSSEPPATTQAAPPEQPVAQPSGSIVLYPESDYLLATGRGDLSKGPLICERVSDTVARMELAKQIRVMVKERAVDRVRERSGQPLEQDIEIVREELTNELLQDVRIVDRTMDTATGICSSTAVMPKNLIIPKSDKNIGASSSPP